MVNYADQTASTTFTLIIPEAAEAEAEAAEAEAAEAEAAEAEAAEAEAAEAEAAEKCGEGTHLEDGICILDETVSIESTSESTSMSSAQTVSTWIYSITFPVLIAFVIAIFLYLISRASRRKTT
jgi:membrane protein involved in colicin uptake